jgi:hypothetical protein
MSASPAAAPGPTAAPANWYPDPTHRHELRYFDGTSWTDQAADAGQTVEDPLGPLPPGLMSWPAPAQMLQAPRLVASVDVPRVKMWVLAVLSLMTFRLQANSAAVVLPLGVAFAVWCWITTARPLAEHRRAGSDQVGNIWAARIVAAVFAVVSVVIVAAAA